MAEPATSGQWLYFRVLAEPNPDRGGLRVWRLHELARRATQLSRREHTTSVVTGSLYTCLKKKGLAEAYSDGRRCTLWRLTAKGLEHAQKEGLLRDTPADLPATGKEEATQTEWRPHLDPLADAVRDYFASQPAAAAPRER